MDMVEDMIPPSPLWRDRDEEKEGTGKMRIRAQVLFVALVAATLALGCAAAAGPASDPFGGRTGEKEIKIFITNLAFLDATVYGLTNGARRRLGRVTGKKETVFTLPFTHSALFQLEVDIMAGPKCKTERMNVDPGDHLELVIRTDNPYLLCAES